MGNKTLRSLSSRVECLLISKTEKSRKSSVKYLIWKYRHKLGKLLKELKVATSNGQKSEVGMDGRHTTEVLKLCAYINKKKKKTL